MNVSVLNNQQFMALAGVAAVALGYLYYKRRQIGEAVNPLSDQNLAYKGTNAVGAAITGDQDWSLGVAIWEFMNPQAVAREQELFTK